MSATEKQCCIIKRIKFFGRSLKIVMQNENGPCPLLAIANVLSLRNELKLPAGIREITQSELITSIVDLLLERSKHFEAAYAADYQQNISEIFPVLQKLTTGVDVNVKFHNLHAFEPTPEVAVFDLLGIPLVHGWLVDPQDAATAAVFGNKSYNELVEMLFLVLGDEEMEALSTGPLRNLSISSHHHMHSFSTIGSPSSSSAAAAAAAGRTPSKTTSTPGSRSLSFAAGRGVEAAAAHTAALQKALQGLAISEEEQQQLPAGDAAAGAAGSTPQQQAQQQAVPGSSIQQPAASSTAAVAAASTAGGAQQQAHVGSSSSPLDQQQQQQQGDEPSNPDAAIESLMEDMMQEVCSNIMPGSIELGDSPTHNLLLTRRLAYEGPPAPSRLQNSSAGGTAAPAAAQGSSSGQPGQAAGGTHSAAAVTAPSAPQQQQQQGGGAPDASKVSAAASAADAAMVRCFMETHCSQLTPYGLSCMGSDLKEHQLAVFFRNNHFSALFKYEGAVYLLVTDQGYEYEPDIVWERLDSVQGDTTFCTADFTPFVPHRAPAVEGDGGAASYSNAVAGDSAAAAAAAGGGDLSALTDLDAAIAASLAVEDEQGGGSQHHHQQQQQYQQHPDAVVGVGSGGGLLGSEHHEDADFALALQLQLQEEEAMARAQQQQQGGRAAGPRVAAVQQQEAQAQPLESLRQMGQRLASGIQQQYAAATDALVGQQQQQEEAAAQQQQMHGRRRTSNPARGRRAGPQEEKCSLM